MTLPLSYSRFLRCRESGLGMWDSPNPNPCESRIPSPKSHRGLSNGGEGRTRTFEATGATDLQSAAFDRFATSPTVCNLECVAFDAYPAVTCAPGFSRRGDGAGEGIRTPDLLITNQLLYRPELRQPAQKLDYSTTCATLATPALSSSKEPPTRFCRKVNRGKGYGSLSNVVYAPQRERFRPPPTRSDFEHDRVTE